MRICAVVSKWAVAKYSVAQASGLLVLMGALGACQHRPVAAPRPDTHRRVETLVVNFIKAWRDDVSAAVPGSPLHARRLGSAVSEERMRTVAESLAVFQDMRAVCGSNRTLEEGGSFNSWFAPLLQELFPRIRLPRSDESSRRCSPTRGVRCRPPTRCFRWPARPAAPLVTKGWPTCWLTSSVSPRPAARPPCHLRNRNSFGGPPTRCGPLRTTDDALSMNGGDWTMPYACRSAGTSSWITRDPLCRLRACFPPAVWATHRLSLAH
jgi:hypothetical protein